MGVRKLPKATGGDPGASSPVQVLVRDEPSIRVPVIEEALTVTKEIVDRGGYRIDKRVETREELVDEFLKTERVEIERRQINTAIAEGAVPQTRQEGDTLIVPVIEEMLSRGGAQSRQAGCRPSGGSSRIFTRMTRGPCKRTSCSLRVAPASQSRGGASGTTCPRDGATGPAFLSRRPHEARPTNARCGTAPEQKL